MSMNTNIRVTTSSINAKYNVDTNLVIYTRFILSIFL